MRKANGTLGNCYRVSHYGIVMFYVPTEQRAERIINMFKKEYDRAYGEENSWVIEKWFIEGEF